MKKYGLISLFSGAGGLDSGFRKAHFKTLVAVEADGYCIETFRRNHPNTKMIHSGVEEVKPSQLLASVKSFKGTLGIIGGPPCQAFSISNVTALPNDPRNSLPKHYAKLVKAVSAEKDVSFIVFENVPGILAEKHKRRYLELKRMLRAAGFGLWEGILDAADYGVPQHRRRLFLIGINAKLHPKCKWTEPIKSRGSISVRDAIHKLPHPVIHTRINGSSVPHHNNHWCLEPRSEKFKKAMILGSNKGRSFRLLEWDKPSWTVAYGNREVHVHPNGTRRLSIYEAMLLQSFPKSYRLFGPITAQVKQVSDAVPPRLAWQIAKQIKRALEK